MRATAITLYAMNQKGLAVLQALVDRFGPMGIRQVIGARDRQVLRDYYDEIQQFCRERGIAFCDRGHAPKRVPGYALAIGWRWLVAGAEKLIIFHDSLLPEYRGFAPLVSALSAQDPLLGVTALYAAPQYDRGPIIAQRQLEVSYPLTVATAIAWMSELYVELALDLVTQLHAGTHPPARPQDESRATYSLWRDAQDYAIDWQRPAAQIRALVDAAGFPYQGATTRLGDTLARVLEVSEQPDVEVVHRQAGKVIFVEEGLPTVVCGSGLLLLRSLRCAQTGADLLPLPQFRTRFT